MPRDRSVKKGGEWGEGKACGNRMTMGRCQPLFSCPQLACIAPPPPPLVFLSHRRGSLATGLRAPPTAHSPKKKQCPPCSSRGAAAETPTCQGRCRQRGGRWGTTHQPGKYGRRRPTSGSVWNASGAKEGPAHRALSAPATDRCWQGPPARRAVAPPNQRGSEENRRAPAGAVGMAALPPAGTTTPPPPRRRRDTTRLCSRGHVGVVPGLAGRAGGNGSTSSASARSRKRGRPLPPATPPRPPPPPPRRLAGASVSTIFPPTKAVGWAPLLHERVVRGWADPCAPPPQEVAVLASPPRAGAAVPAVPPPAMAAR